MDSLPHNSSDVRYNEKRSNQLGMPLGTAWARLRKNVLFHLLQKWGENVCFVCKKSIDTTEELSIEHKLPWQNNDPDLFWDLDNIAFSHLRCNKPHTRVIPSNKKIGPEGTAWCKRCKAFLDKDNFQKNCQEWDGLENLCRECKSVTDKVYKKRGRYRQPKDCSSLWDR